MKLNIQKNENRATFREVTYKKKAVFGSLICIIAVLGAISANFVPAMDQEVVADVNTTFQVNVVESLSVSVTTPVAGATGDPGSFLRNTVTLAVASNNNNGFTASMYTKDGTNLAHTNLSNTNIQTLDSDSGVLRSSFTPDRWGYSLKNGSYNGKTYGETDAGADGSMYYPLKTSSSPITVLTGNGSGSQNIYFGTKVSSSTPSGTYMNTIVLSVVSDVINAGDNPAIPEDPVRPSTDTTINDNSATYTGTDTSTGVGISTSDGTNPYNGTTVYTTSSTNSGATPPTTTTTTEISGGDNTTTYPRGVRSTTESQTVASVVNDSPLPIALAATAGVAAAAGIGFFIAAKRHEDDDDEETTE